MTSVCHCVGYKTNPGGVCCKDLHRPPPNPGIVVERVPTMPPLTEEQTRKIIREEITCDQMGMEHSWLHRCFPPLPSVCIICGAEESQDPGDPSEEVKRLLEEYRTKAANDDSVGLDPGDARGS